MPSLASVGEGFFTCREWKSFDFLGQIFTLVKIIDWARNINKPQYSLWHLLAYSCIKPNFCFFSLVACNLMIEYADFYENIQASSETLQCPRCSASVPANPGVCSNCGENVFQCHKCRSINYDEKDPFLCNACGFCKYAKFEYTLTSRPCCAVDPIGNFNLQFNFSPICQLN